MNADVGRIGYRRRHLLHLFLSQIFSRHGNTNVILLTHDSSLLRPKQAEMHQRTPPPANIDTETANVLTSAAPPPPGPAPSSPTCAPRPVSITCIPSVLFSPHHSGVGGPRAHANTHTHTLSSNVHRHLCLPPSALMPPHKMAIIPAGGLRMEMFTPQRPTPLSFVSRR